MKKLLLVTACLVVLFACSCSGKTTSEPEEPHVEIIPFERVEIGSPDSCYVSIDQDASGDYTCTIQAVQARRAGGGSSPIRSFDINIKAELRFREDLSGTFSRWVDDELIQERLFTTEFFGSFGIFNDSGHPRASLESGENFASLLLFDDHGQLRIKLHISELQEVWVEAVPKMFFYDEDGNEIEI